MHVYFMDFFFSYILTHSMNEPTLLANSFSEQELLASCWASPGEI